MRYAEISDAGQIERCWCWWERAQYGGFCSAREMAGRYPWLAGAGAAEKKQIVSANQREGEIQK
jgi:hypothetical protein